MRYKLIYEDDFIETGKFPMDKFKEMHAFITCINSRDSNSRWYTTNDVTIVIPAPLKVLYADDNDSRIIIQIQEESDKNVYDDVEYDWEDVGWLTKTKCNNLVIVQNYTGELRFC